MPVILDLVCKNCGDLHPQVSLRTTIKQARCPSCGKKALRPSWKRGKSPSTLVFRAVPTADGHEVDSPEELALRTAKVMHGHDDSARIIIDDDRAAARVRVDEIRHETLENRKKQGIDAQLVAEIDEEAKAAQRAIDADVQRGVSLAEAKAKHEVPTARDAAMLARHGTTDPTPKAVKTLGVDSKADFDTPRPVAEHDYGDQAP